MMKNENLKLLWHKHERLMMLLIATTVALLIGCSQPIIVSLEAVTPTSIPYPTQVPTVSATPTPTQVKVPPAINIGSRLQLFVDDWLVYVATNTLLTLHHPSPAEVALEFDATWEGPTAAYFTVLEDDDRFKMYYRCHNDENEKTCYAESIDGIHWNKPSLGLFEVNGSTDNNIVWEGPESHNFAPFIDKNPDRSPNEKYKALGGQPPVALVSSDSINWKKLREEPVLTKGKFDSQNVAFWDQERGYYVAYYRTFVGNNRSISRSISLNFTEWSDGTPIDLGETPREHLYTNAVTPYFRAPHILLAFPSRFEPKRQLVKDHPLPGVSDAVFMTSRDGQVFDRVFMEAFVAPGRDLNNWTERSNMIAWGLLSTDDDEISIYYTQHYRHSTAHLRRGTLRTDGFVSLAATYEGGEFVTWPISFEGNQLEINFRTSAIGGLRIELQYPNGDPIDGFTLAEADEMFGDDISRVVTWRGKGDLSHLEGRALRLHFVFKDAEVYSFRFAADS